MRGPFFVGFPSLGKLPHFRVYIYIYIYASIYVLYLCIRDSVGAYDWREWVVRVVAP